MFQIHDLGERRNLWEKSALHNWSGLHSADLGRESGTERSGQQTAAGESPFVVSLTPAQGAAGVCIALWPFKLWFFFSPRTSSCEISYAYILMTTIERKATKPDEVLRPQELQSLNSEVPKASELLLPTTCKVAVSGFKNWIISYELLRMGTKDNVKVWI